MDEVNDKYKVSEKTSTLLSKFIFFLDEFIIHPREVKSIFILLFRRSYCVPYYHIRHICMENPCLSQLSGGVDFVKSSSHPTFRSFLFIL